MTSQTYFENISELETRSMVGLLKTGGERGRVIVLMTEMCSPNFITAMSDRGVEYPREVEGFICYDVLDRRQTNMPEAALIYI